MNAAFDVLGIGLNATDTLVLVQEFPSYAGKVSFQEELISPGGQVASAVVACSRLGLRSKYVGSIGDDDRGRIQRESLSGTGVDTSSLIVRQGCPNQTAYIIIDKSTGERTVFWQRADCLRLSPQEIRTEDVINARFLHIDGCDVDAAAHAASIARAHSIPVSLDVDTIYPNFKSVLKNVDYLVASSTWPGKWTGDSDPISALERIQQEYEIRVAAMTLGDRGALALHEGRKIYSPGFEVHCADTTGAGDVFHGAFCYAMLHEMATESALEFSNAAAALNCTAIGARGHIPTLNEVESLIALGAAGKIKRHMAPEIAERCLESKAQAAFVSSAKGSDAGR